MVGSIDRLRRFASYRALPDLPLVVAVSELTSSALAPFERRRVRSLRSAGGFTLFVAVFCAVLIAAGRRERRQNEQLSVELAERHRAEIALREAGERYRDLFENANDAIFLLDERRRYVDVNRRAVEIFGYTREEFLGRSVFEVIPPEQARRSEAAFRELAEHGQYHGFEGRVRTKDGRWLDIEVSSSAILRDGVFAGSRDIVRDITERKRAEEERKRLLEAISIATEGIAITDDQDRFIYVNDAHARIYGRLPDEFIGKSWRDTVPPEMIPSIESDLSKTLHNRAVRLWAGECPGLRKDGTTIPTEIAATSRWDEKGAYLGHICIVRNITERHLLEEERLKTQKLESIGTLAGGIAHDFNNLLQGIFGYISMAKLCIDQKDRSLAMIEQAEKALHQSVSLTTQLLTFSKGGKPVREPLALGPVIENAVKFALSGSRTEYRLVLDPGLWRVDADAGQLGQVIQNIVLNADQAMPRGGCVEITARNAPPSDPDLPPGLARRNHVVISIRDSGAGIPEQDLEQDLRPLLHDQGERQRAGARDLLLHRQEPRGADLREIGSRQGEHLFHLSAGLGGRGGGAAAPRRAPRERGPPGSSSWTTRRSSGTSRGSC